MQTIPTPGKSTCADVAAFLGLPITQTVKSIVLATDPPTDKSHPGKAATPGGAKIFLLLVRGDHDLNEVKVGKLAPFAEGFRFATVDEIVANFGTEPGYLGPVSLPATVTMIADRTVALMANFVVGANQKDHHTTGVHWGRDLAEPALVADIRNVVEGDPSPCGKGRLKIERGIEVGHVFYLGTKYSEAMKATTLDETGKPRVMEMGCYGIGVTRIVGAAIEQNHDEKGIFWPRAIAPFEVVVCPVGANKSAAVKEAAEKVYAELSAAGYEVILDDRDERPGVMFADWELIGVPVRVTIGERSLREGRLELLKREGMQASDCGLTEVCAAVGRLMG
jgi:prolyl-tRNA synthetase